MATSSAIRCPMITVGCRAALSGCWDRVLDRDSRDGFGMSALPVRTIPAHCQSINIRTYPDQRSHYPIISSW